MNTYVRTRTLAALFTLPVSSSCGDDDDGPATEAKTLVVEIGEDGRFEVDRVDVDDSGLQMRLCSAVKDKLVPTVDIKVDQNTPHEKVVQAMDVAKSCGIADLVILNRHGGRGSTR